MAPPADLDPLAGRLHPGGREDRLPDRVGERLQVVCLRRVRVGRIDREADHIPAPRGREPPRVRGAQVVAVRLDVGGERAEHGGGVAVDVGERVQGGLLAGGPGTEAGHHRPASPTRAVTPGAGSAASPRASPEPGSRASPTTADRTYLGPLTPSPGHCSRRVSRKDVRSAAVRSRGGPCAAAAPAPGGWPARRATRGGPAALRSGLCTAATGAARSARPGSGGATGMAAACGGPRATGRAPAPDPGGRLRRSRSSGGGAA